MPVAAVLFENVDQGGRSFSVNDGENVPLIPPPLGGQGSSIYVYGPHWITFWESAFYNAGNDQLWVAPPPAGQYWIFHNLHTFYRPHGNNHWGDLIKSVSFSGEPVGDNDNRTIVHPNGSVTNGNSFHLSAEGVWTFVGAKQGDVVFGLATLDEK
jgi:hypothetical protein